MFKDAIRLSGRLTIKKFNEKAELIYQTEVPNLVVNGGKEFLASRVIGADFDPMTHMAVGDDASTPTLSQTALVNELARIAFDTALASGSNVTFTSVFPAGTATGNLVEAGIFNTDDTAVLVFDGDDDVNSSSDEITYVAHGLLTGDKVTYTDGGGTTIPGLADGNTYYIVKISNDVFKLATTYANAMAGTPVTIDIGDGLGANHKITYGTMLCRTTFPVISKGAGETVAITWTVTVG